MSAIKGNPQHDFKEQNPIIAQIVGFANVYNNHKPDIASKICWAMFMLEEESQEDNPLARIIDREERLEEIQKSYYKLDTSTEEYKTLVSDFSKFVLTTEQSLYRIHLRKFNEITTFLDNLTLDNDKDFEKYIKIMDKLDKMWKSLEVVKERMVEANNKNRIRGNAQLSVREKRRK